MLHWTQWAPAEVCLHQLEAEMACRLPGSNACELQSHLKACWLVLGSNWSSKLQQGKSLAPLKKQNMVVVDAQAW